MSKITIITINYNDAIGLEKTILSVLKQSLPDLEFVVIDGNSSDGSKAVIEKYQDQLSYWVSEPDSGIYEAMNKGIKASKGDYLLFMNSGDVLIDDETILSVCVEKLQEDIVAFDCFLEKDNKITGRRTHIERPTLYYIYRYGLKHQSTFVKRLLFEKIGLYNENYKIASDYEFWIRCFLVPTTTAKSYTIPIAVFQLNGISQQGGWYDEMMQMKKELLPHLIIDFEYFDGLLRYGNSRILKLIVRVQNWFTKLNF